MKGSNMTTCPLCESKAQKNEIFVTKYAFTSSGKLNKEPFSNTMGGGGRNNIVKATAPLH